ncbi:MAG: hypothetical protein QOG03_2625 [Actinomycetota bacterium]|jgi:hypothetical protein|nr:hypothetical protein [Actinomycetota bacterium]
MEEMTGHRLLVEIVVAAGIAVILGVLLQTVVHVPAAAVGGIPVMVAGAQFTARRHRRVHRSA